MIKLLYISNLFLKEAVNSYENMIVVELEDYDLIKEQFLALFTEMERLCNKALVEGRPGFLVEVSLLDTQPDSNFYGSVASQFATLWGNLFSTLSPDLLYEFQALIFSFPSKISSIFHDISKNKLPKYYLDYHEIAQSFLDIIDENYFNFDFAFYFGKASNLARTNFLYLKNFISDISNITNQYVNEAFSRYESDRIEGEYYDAQFLIQISLDYLIQILKKYIDYLKKIKLNKEVDRYLSKISEINSVLSKLKGEKYTAEEIEEFIIEDTEEPAYQELYEKLTGKNFLSVVEERLKANPKDENLQQLYYDLTGEDWSN